MRSPDVAAQIFYGVVLAGTVTETGMTTSTASETTTDTDMAMHEYGHNGH